MVEQKVIIRSYEPKEKSERAFFELASQSFNHGSPWTFRQYADTLVDKSLKFFVAETEESIVGYAGGKVLFDEAEIYSVAVALDYQKRQIATRLVKAFIEYCKDKEVSVIFLEVRQSNKAARRFYETLNFKEVGTRKNYYTHPVEDAILMQCTIGKLEHDEQ